MESAQSLGDLTERNVELIARMEKASHFHRTIGERVADFVSRGRQEGPSPPKL
jgi:uncharacterized membrane protein